MIKIISLFFIVLFILVGCNSSTKTNIKSKRIDIYDDNDLLNQSLITAWKDTAYTLIEFKKQIIKSRKDEKYFREIINKYQKGDLIWYYNSPPVTWDNLMGASGYALFRKGKLIINIDTVIN